MTAAATVQAGTTLLPEWALDPLAKGRGDDSRSRLATTYATILALAPVKIQKVVRVVISVGRGPVEDGVKDGAPLGPLNWAGGVGDGSPRGEYGTSATDSVDSLKGVLHRPKWGG